MLVAALDLKPLALKFVHAPSGLRRLAAGGDPRADVLVTAPSSPTVVYQCVLAEPVQGALLVEDGAIGMGAVALLLASKGAAQQYERAERLTQVMSGTFDFPVFT